MAKNTDRQLQNGKMNKNQFLQICLNGKVLHQH